jgi:hypothetical protein
MTLKQRSTKDVPGSNGTVRLTIDDITRGQVMVSVAGKEGGVLLATTSLKPGGSVTFMLGQDAYLLKLKELNNALMGQDFGTFIVSAGLSERAKIERLIAQLESTQNAVFIRNGTEHTAKEAAEHLRSKWKAADSRIRTAKQFVEQIATKSSTSGEPYQIRLANGSVVFAGDYLNTLLAGIEHNR